MAFEEVKRTSFTNLEVGETIEGKLVSIEEGKFGDNYVIQKTDGSRITLGSKTALQNRIDESMVGKNIRISRTEDQESKASGRVFQGFRVELEK